MNTSSTVNFLDDTYSRMKKSADRIAAVLGIERPKLDRDLVERPRGVSPVQRGISPINRNPYEPRVRPTQSDLKDY
jgi:hypothetical protein